MQGRVICGVLRMEPLFFGILFLSIIALLLSITTPVVVLLIGRYMRKKELNALNNVFDNQMSAVVNEQHQQMQIEAELLQHAHMLEMAIEDIPNVALICLNQKLNIVAVGGSEMRHFALSNSMVGKSILTNNTILSRPEIIDTYRTALSGDPAEMIVPTMLGTWRLDVQPLRNGQVFGVRILASRHFPN